MSKNNNVNPGQYKVAGRERQGENLEQTKDKQAFKASQAPGQPKTGRKKTATGGPARTR